VRSRFGSIIGINRIVLPLWFVKTPDEGADTIGWLATLPDPTMVSGRLFLDRRPRPFDRVPGTRLTAEARKRLWDRVVELTGGIDPAPST
jgi:hypothetical protein